MKVLLSIRRLIRSWMEKDGRTSTKEWLNNHIKDNKRVLTSL